MNNQTHRKAGINNSNFLWKMQMVHINLPVHSKVNHGKNQKSVNTKHYVPWLSLVAVEI